MTRIPLPLILSFIAGSSLALLASVYVPQVAATSTRVFRIDSQTEFSTGEVRSATVTSEGNVQVGEAYIRIPLGEAQAALSYAENADGDVFVGTSPGGEIYRVRGERAELFATVDALAVRALTLGPDGTLYAGTLPHGVVYAISPSGTVREFVNLEDAEHVWSLAWSESLDRLFAATGPEGKLYAIDTAGRAEVYYDSDDPHILSLAQHPDGRLFVGTDGDALLAEINGPGVVRILHDFTEEEVTAIDLQGDTLAVVTNKFPALTSRGSKAQLSETLLRRRRPRPGKGRAWRVDTAGRVERLFENNDAHFTSVNMDESGTVYVGSAGAGRVFAVSSEGAHSVWADVDERQVLGIHLEGNPGFFLSGDGGAIYRAQRTGQTTSTWTSSSLDSAFLSRWGQLNWRGEGALRLQTRSGNTATPNSTWSDWSSPLTTPGPVRSPSARYIQVRATLPNSNQSSLRAVELFYLPQNQAARIHNVRLAAETSSRSSRASKTKAKAKSTASGASTAQAGQSTPRPSSRYRVSWNTVNPDGDSIRYRLRYRRDGSTAWRALHTEDVLISTTHFTWETEGLADGWYVVEVEASDEQQNPAELALRTSARSEPSLVDNHPPRVERLRFVRGQVNGVAVDGFGPIQQLEYAIDGRGWQQLHPADGLFDTREEGFRFSPSAATAGTHVISVRARDASGNQATSEIEAVFGGE